MEKYVEVAQRIMGEVLDCAKNEKKYNIVKITGKTQPSPGLIYSYWLNSYNYLVVYENLDYVMSFNSVCWGRLNNVNISQHTSKPKLVCGFRGRFNTKKVSPKVERRQRKFIKFLVEDSPWKDIILCKDEDFIYDKGLILDANTPSNFMASALVAFKFCFDLSSDWKEIENWYELVNSKVNPTLALILACITRRDTVLKKNNRAENLVFSYLNFTRKNVKAAVENKPSFLSRPYSEFSVYRGGVQYGDDYIHQLFLEDEYNSRTSLKSSLSKSLVSKEVVVEDEWGDKMKITKTPWEDNLKNVVKWCKETFPEYH